MSDVQVDLMNQGNAQGEVAAYAAANGRLDIGRMRPYVGQDGRVYVTVHTGGDPKRKENYKTLAVNSPGTLRRDEWKQLDEAVLMIAEKRLGGFQDLIDNGLVYTLGNAMGTTVLEYHDVGDALVAELSMDAVTRAQGDRQHYKTVYLPIPIIHADYEINQRVLEASRSLGNPLDTTMAERAARKVSEKLEALLFTDTSYAFGGGTIYSYVNHPQRNTLDLSKAWDDGTKTGKNIVDDVLEMKQESIEAFHYGPWMLYIPTSYETKLDEDYSDSKGTNTIRERILAIAGISGIRIVDTLPDDNVLLVQMTSDVVRLVRGLGVQNIQWQTEGGFVNKFKTITIQVPQIRSDQKGNSGLVHATVS